MPKVYSIITKDIALATKYILDGRLVAFPTGTSYGLAANALDGYALQRLSNLKERPDDKAYTVFLADEMWPTHLNLTSEEKKFLADMPNEPLTLLVKPKPSIEHLAKDNLVGLRVIDHPLMSKLAEESQLPLTATSANKTEAPPCLSVDCITSAFPGLLPDEQLQEKDPRGASGTTYDLSLAAIIDAGKLSSSKPSTIVKFTRGRLQIIRPGAWQQ
jgi:tRNA threonylcarbamoyl adenosine modification protein (Sua5/YciO/YrdC/YwlC family)